MAQLYIEFIPRYLLCLLHQNNQMKLIYYISVVIEDFK